MGHTLLSLVVLLACAGCAANNAAPATPVLPAAPTTPNAVAQAPVPPVDTVRVVIGHAAPLTGSIWHLGRDNELGARMAIEDLVCAEPGMAPRHTPQSQAFATKFRQRFGLDVVIYAPYVYDAVTVMAEAMVKAGSADPQHYLPVLAATRDFPGVTDTITFEPRGNLASGWMSLHTYRDGRRVRLESVRATAP